MLKVEDIHVYYGNIHAVKGISFHVDEGEIVSLIGANGAGKSTVLKTISGVLRAKSGSISFLGHDITKVEAHKIVRQGIAHVPEGRRIFLKMTVMENLEMGAFTRKEVSKEDVEKVFERFPRLKERQSQIAGTLSGGEQQMLAIARGLMSEPKVLLLDEPSLGLAPLIVNDIMSIIKNINQEGIAVLLVEQNARKALAIADHACVLERGRVVKRGTGAELAADEEIIASYLGKKK